MATKKIDLKRVILSADSDNILKIQGFEDEEIPFENLTNELNEMIKLGKPLNIKVNKAGKGGGGRKKQIKYRCPKCNKKISSKEEDLKVLCEECNVLFEQE